MRKTIISIPVLALAILGIANIAGADTMPPNQTATESIAVSSKYLSSVIDGVEVPFEVLQYAQLKYQGHAVTQVIRDTRDGNPTYKLRVDNDGDLYDDECLFLIYDTKWKLLSTEKVLPTEQFLNKIQALPYPGSAALRGNDKSAESDNHTGAPRDGRASNNSLDDGGPGYDEGQQPPDEVDNPDYSGNGQTADEKPRNNRRNAND